MGLQRRTVVRQPEEIRHGNEDLADKRDAVRSTDDAVAEARRGFQSVIEGFYVILKFIKIC